MSARPIHHRCLPFRAHFALFNLRERESERGGDRARCQHRRFYLNSFLNILLAQQALLHTTGTRMAGDDVRARLKERISLVIGAHETFHGCTRRQTRLSILVRLSVLSERMRHDSCRPASQRIDLTDSSASIDGTDVDPGRDRRDFDSSCFSRRGRRRPSRAYMQCERSVVCHSRSRWRRYSSPSKRETAKIDDVRSAANTSGRQLLCQHRQRLVTASIERAYGVAMLHAGTCHHPCQRD